MASGQTINNPYRFTRCRALLACGAMLAMLAPAATHAGPITPFDLNALVFTFGRVDIAPDGTWMTLAEEPPGFLVSAEHNPAFDPPPPVIFPAADTFFVFNYEFTGLANDDDTLTATLLDGGTGDAILGSEFQTATHGTGVGELDLEPYLGLVLGLQFTLGGNPLDADFGAFVTVSNARFEMRSAAAVPEPSTLLLTLLAIPALRGRRRTRRRGVKP